MFVVGVLEVLRAGTSDVRELLLGDADWATCSKYGAQLVELLAKYSGSLRALDITSRALVQPNGKKAHALKVSEFGAPENGLVIVREGFALFGSVRPNLKK